MPPHLLGRTSVSICDAVGVSTACQRTTNVRPTYPIDAVLSAIVTIAERTAGLRPYRSPIHPKNTPPIGRNRKAIQKTTKVFMRLRAASESGKNKTEKTSEK